MAEKANARWVPLPVTACLLGQRPRGCAVTMVSISAASRCLPPLRAKAISIHLCGQATLLFSPSLVEIRSYFSGAISFLNCSLIQTSRRTTDFQHARSSRVFFLLNFDELVKCSGRSIGYGPTIETVRVPIDKIVALIIE